MIIIHYVSDNFEALMSCLHMIVFYAASLCHFSDVFKCILVVADVSVKLMMCDVESETNEDDNDYFETDHRK